MSDPKKPKGRMRHCFNCGANRGVYADYDPLDTCGKQECERAVREVVAEQESEDAARFGRAQHEREWGW